MGDKNLLRVKKVLGFAIMSAVLAACHRPVLSTHLIAPNPYGGLKKSALCQLTPVQSDKEGRKLSTEMTIRSDDGFCTLILKKPEGGHYASFGVVPHPQQGKVLMYNYGGQTYVNYRADTAYAGSDAFTAILIPSIDAPRIALIVKVTVQAAPIVPEIPGQGAQQDAPTSLKMARQKKTSASAPKKIAAPKSGM